MGAEAGASRPIIHLSHVDYRYEDGTAALDDLSLDVPRGQHLCLIGANGSGKSTLASVLCGLSAPDGGTVELAGEAVCTEGQADFEAYRRARRHIGLVFQNPDDQIVTTVVEDDVAFGPENLGVPADEIGQRVERELRRVALADFARRDPTKLSGGQQQRVAIAAALAMEPDILVLDEPGALLDVRGRRAIMRVMEELRRDGTTLVHITHFMEEALAADRVVVLDQGSVLFDGTPQEVFSHTDEIRALGLEEPFAARLSERLAELGVDVGWTCSDGVLAERVAPLIAPSLEPGGPCMNVEDTAHAASPLVTASHVSFRYAATLPPALDDVSLEVPRGTSCALVGQTGSGKSTLARLLAALDVPDAGHIVVDGTDTARRRDRRLLHGKVGYVMQRPERQLFAQTVAEDIAYGPRNLRLPEEAVNRRVQEALALVGLEEKRDASPFELSGGQMRLCALAGVLAMEPSLIVLDEPMAGLDPRGRDELRAILDAVHARGTTTIHITHSMEDAAASDQVAVLDSSKILMAGRPRDVFCARNRALLASRGLGLPASVSFALRLGELLGHDTDRACVPQALGCPMDAEELARAIARLAGGAGWA